LLEAEVVHDEGAALEAQAVAARAAPERGHGEDVAGVAAVDDEVAVHSGELAEPGEEEGGRRVAGREHGGAEHDAIEARASVGELDGLAERERRVAVVLVGGGAHDDRRRERGVGQARRRIERGRRPRGAVDPERGLTAEEDRAGAGRGRARVDDEAEGGLAAGGDGRGLRVGHTVARVGVAPAEIAGAVRGVFAEGERRADVGDLDGQVVAQHGRDGDAVVARAQHGLVGDHRDEAHLGEDRRVVRWGALRRREAACRDRRDRGEPDSEAERAEGGAEDGERAHGASVPRGEPAGSAASRGPITRCGARLGAREGRRRSALASGASLARRRAGDERAGRRSLS
jgi:hypothetical protein